MRRNIDELLEEARRLIARLEPAAAWASASDGALVIDLRCELDRQSGVVQGSLHIPRTVLEWRLDPASPWRNPHVGDLDQRLVLLCTDGYSSSLAGASLHELGFKQVCDVIGGFVAWRLAGLPLIPPGPPRALDELAGMRAPEPSRANGRANLPPPRGEQASPRESSL